MSAIPDGLVMLTDDSAIKLLLIKAGLSLSPPTPPNDATTAFFNVGGMSWIATLFYHPGDEGYVALGIPDSASPEQRKLLLAFWAEGMSAMARANGKTSAFEDAILSEAGQVEDS